jgi:hypothetical protein
MNQLRCPSPDEQIKKMGYIYIMEYLAIKKNDVCHLQKNGINGRSTC